MATIERPLTLTERLAGTAADEIRRRGRAIELSPDAVSGVTVELDVGGQGTIGDCYVHVSYRTAPGKRPKRGPA